MYKQITIKTLFKQGQKKTSIARELGCHRNTVANVLERDRIIEKQIRTKSSCCQPYHQQIKDYLDQAISRLRIWEILQENYGFLSSYDALCKYIQKHFPKRVEAYGVQVVEPGEVAEVDFGYLGLLPGPLSKPAKAYGLAVILPYSRLDYYAICFNQKLETLTHELTNAFKYFGGVTKRLKVDNMKTAIFKNQHYDLEFNQDFLELAQHFGTVITPCSPYSPEQKGTVESGIKYLQRNFLAGRVFSSEADLKDQLKGWMDSYANLRVHGTTKKIPREVFNQEEKDKLQPLPQEEFAFFNRTERVVSASCHIHLETNYYSVPSHLVGKTVTIRWNEHLVRVVFAGEQVALHGKARGSGNYVTQRVHLPDYKVYSETEYQARYEARMAGIGEYAHQYFTWLLTTKQSYWFRNVRIILGLEKEYGRHEVDLSLKRALYYQATDIVTIKNILAKKLYLLEEEPLLTKSVHEVNEGEVSDMSRSLNYYAEGVA